MELGKITEGGGVLKWIGVEKSREITHLCCDYKQAKQDSIFFAIKGGKTDGTKFAHHVLKRGGVVATDDKEYARWVKNTGGKNLLLCENARSAMSHFSANFFGNPQQSLKIIFVVGTNGKTSTCNILKQILEYSGIRTAIIGTLHSGFEDVAYKTDFTTPDPIELFGILQDIKIRGGACVVMEASAHAIALCKLDAIKPDVAIFSNLSQDHLDFFGDMQSYKNAKKSLFQKYKIGIGVVNADDGLGKEIIKTCDVPILSYGIKNPADAFLIESSAIKSLEDKLAGGRALQNTQSEFEEFLICYLDDKIPIKTKLLGKFNKYNILACACCAKYLGVESDVISQGIEKISEIEGRYQIVPNTEDKKVVVDYAHTPDGIENILCELAERKHGKLISIFGCGGDRDKTKRGKMAEACEKYSDFVIVTSDNPRSEDPQKIANDAFVGIKNPKNAMIITDRETAIKEGIKIANTGDTVAILGKGHEKYIEENGERRYFSDVETAKKYLV